MENVIQDLRYGFRLLAKRPAFAVASMLILAFGIGANSIIFSVAATTFLRALPYKDASSLVMIWATKTNTGDQRVSIAPGDFAEWQSRNEVFEDLAAMQYTSFRLTGADLPDQVLSGAVTPNFFALLGIDAIKGRPFLSEESQPGHGNVVILSYGFWQSHFAGDSDVIGRPINLNGKSYTIIGVLPPGFKFDYSANTNLWVPLTPDSNALAQHGAGALRVVGRLKEAVTVKQAQADMESIAGQLRNEFPRTNSDMEARVSPLREEIVGQIRPMILMLSVACAFVLIVGCANLASVLMTQSLERQKEIAIRLAVGAKRSRIIQQILTENVMLSLLGGISAFLLAIGGVRLLVNLVPDDFPRKDDVTIDAWVFGFNFALAVVTGVIFSLLPALLQSKPNLNKSLAGTTEIMKMRLRPHGLRNLLVILEVSLTLMLLVGANLILSSVFKLQMSALGFDAKNKLTMKVSLLREKYPKSPQQAAFFTQAIEEISAIPGIRSAAVVMPLPLDGNGFIYPFGTSGDEGKAAGDLPKAFYSIVSPAYFQTMDIHLLAGRLFTDLDGPQVQPVAIINESMARQFWPDSSSLDRHIYVNKKDLTIVGVVQDVRQSKLDADVTPHIYQSYLQSPAPSMYLVASTSSEAMNMVPIIRDRILALDKDQPLQDIATMEDRRDKWIGERKLVLVLLLSFAIMALSIAAFGIYGVIAQNVAQRTQEIGIRLALGARPMDVLKLVLGQGLAVTLIGISIGLAGAFALHRVLSSWLFGVSATDPMIMIVTSILLVTIAALACYVPASRAMKVDPASAIRYE